MGKKKRGNRERFRQKSRKRLFVVTDENSVVYIAVFRSIPAMLVFRKRAERNRRRSSSRHDRGNRSFYFYLRYRRNGIIRLFQKNCA